MCLTSTKLFSGGCAVRDFRRQQSWIVGFCYGLGRDLGSFRKTMSSLDWETELLNSFEAVVHRDFPNPHRIGCPGRDSLAGLAACRGDAAPAQVLAHIRQCAPCFDELRELRTKTKL
jgi:hypothetical protein